MRLPSVDFLLACEAVLQARCETVEAEYSDALRQAVTFRLFFLTALSMWADDRRRLEGAETRLRQLLGATPWHSDDVETDPGE